MDRGKIYILIAVELFVIGSAIFLYSYLLYDFRYRILLIFPTILIMANSAIAINAFYDKGFFSKRKAEKERRKRYENITKSKTRDHSLSGK